MSSKRPRILWLKSEIPYPLDQGSNFIAFSLFHLLRDHFDITYLCLVDSNREDWKLKEIQKLVEVQSIARPNRKSLVHRCYYAARLKLRNCGSCLPGEVYYQVPALLRDAVRQRMESGGFDLLFFHYWLFSELGDWLARYNTAALLHDNEMDRIESELNTQTSSIRRLFSRRKVEYIFQSHTEMMRRVRNVFFYHEYDRQSFFKRAKATYPNARVFPYFYQFGDKPEVKRLRDTVIFTGKMSYLPNVVAAQRLVNNIWPAVKAAHPSAKLLLAGGNPAAQVRALAGVPGVTVTGFVKDIRALVASASVYVAPIDIGGGLKIKLMEAAELESAIVGTPFAFRGFDVQPGRDFVPANTDTEFAEAIVRLLKEPEERVALGSNARRAIYRQFSSDIVKSRVLGLFEELTLDRTDPKAG